MSNPMKNLGSKDAKLVMAHMYVAFVALAVGATMGLLQVLERTGKFTLPSWLSYYQVLTVHGVVLGLVLTTFFIIGFMLAAQSITTGGYNNTERNMSWIGYVLMLVGTLAAAIMILLNEATVLFTFYVPLQDRKSTRLNSSHVAISYAVFCLIKKKKKYNNERT